MLRFIQRIVLSGLVLAAGASQLSAQTTCDRACLRTMLDQYLNAVIKHDPNAAPLVVGFRKRRMRSTCGPAMVSGRR